MKLVKREEFKEMMALGFIEKGEFTQTMRKHSKSKRHRKYVVEDKYEEYLKYKSSNNKL